MRHLEDIKKKPFLCFKLSRAKINLRDNSIRIINHSQLSQKFLRSTHDTTQENAEENVKERRRNNKLEPKFVRKLVAFYVEHHDAFTADDIMFVM